MHTLVKQMQGQNIIALAKAITMVENNHPEKLTLLSDVFPLQQSTHYIGITGAPGAGKSSLVNCLISCIREAGLTVAVIAVDPTSPFSGGALLADRVRMNEHFTDEGVFIRSMATRGSLGGLARATKDTLILCGAYGFDIVLVETVGVGQSELDIMKVVDTTVVVLTPNSGDALQIFKAGIMEIADIFVINKADLHGVGKLRGLLKDLVMMAATEDYITAIVQTISTENKGINNLWKQMKEHHKYIYSTKKGEERRGAQQKLEVSELIREEIWQDVQLYLESNEAVLPMKAMSNPYKLASDALKKWKRDVGIS